MELAYWMDDGDDDTVSDGRLDDWVAFQKKQKVLRKKLGTPPMRKKKFFKKKTVGAVEPNSSDIHAVGQPSGKGKGSLDRPPGVSAEQWSKRVPCPGCGSRWHRDCSNRSQQSKGLSNHQVFTSAIGVLTW